MPTIHDLSGLTLTRPMPPWPQERLIEEDSRLAGLRSADFRSVIFDHALRKGEKKISFRETRQRFADDPSRVMLGSAFARGIVDQGEEVLEDLLNNKHILYAFTVLGSLYQGHQGQTMLLSVYRHPIGGWHYFPFETDLDMVIDRRWVFPLIMRPS